MGMSSEDIVLIEQGKNHGEPTVVTVNCPDKAGLGCDLVRNVLEFGLYVTRGVRDAISLEREASRACCRGDPVTVMNVEEWGIFLVTVTMFRRTNAAGGTKCC